MEDRKMDPLTDYQRDLVEGNLDTARNAARSMLNIVPLPEDELFSWACEGLVRASTRFDPTKGPSFRTFAWKRAIGHIMDKVQEHARAEAKAQGWNHEVLPLAAFRVVPDPAQIAEEGDFYERMLQPLNFRDRRIMEMRVDGWTMKSIGKQFGLSESRICQILKYAVIPLLQRRYAALTDEVESA
jgi:RNA polymerase sigma factor (sigma-70 family)